MSKNYKFFCQISWMLLSAVARHVGCVGVWSCRRRWSIVFWYNPTCLLKFFWMWTFCWWHFESEAKWKPSLLLCTSWISFIIHFWKISSTYFHPFLHEVIFCPKTASDIHIKRKKTSKLQNLTNEKWNKMVLAEGFEPWYFGLVSTLKSYIS